MASQSYSRSRPKSESILAAEALLSRYPDLSDQELATLIELFPRLRILDVGMMTADDRLAGKLKAFDRDHGRKIKPPLPSVIAFMAFPTLVIAVLLWNLVQLS